MNGNGRSGRAIGALGLAPLLLAAQLAAGPAQTAEIHFGAHSTPFGRPAASPIRQAPIESQVGEVRVVAHSDWPTFLTEGWFPLRVAAENRGERAVRVQLEARSHFRRQQVRVRSELELEPGGAGGVELLLPVLAWLPSQYQLHVRVGPDEDWLPPIGPGEYPRSEANPHLVVPAPGTNAATVEVWRSHLAQAAGLSPGLTALPNAASLARHPAAYSSVRSVSLDVADGLPAGEALDVLLSWVRTGGDLALYGPDAERTARAHPVLASWMEPRFQSSAPGARPGVWRLGHGRLLVGDFEPPYMDGNFSQALLEPPEPKPAWIQSPELDELPVRALTVFLILFALLIGPVNFILVRRGGRPTLLLLTVPLIALLGSVALVLYAILAQGLDVRSARLSWTVLDQRAALASVRELRDVFAGTSPGPGLRPGPRTSVVLPLPPQYESHPRGSLDVEQRGGQLLAGDFLRVRVTQTSHVYSERPTRARLDVRREGEALLVENGLGVRAHELFLRTGPDELWVLRDPLVPGARVRLTPADELEKGRLRRMTTGPWRRWDTIPVGTWLAQLDRSPFLDDCGIELEETFGKHLVYGILEDPEGGR